MMMMMFWASLRSIYLTYLPVEPKQWGCRKREENKMRRVQDCSMQTTVVQDGTKCWWHTKPPPFFPPLSNPKMELHMPVQAVSVGREGSLLGHFLLTLRSILLRSPNLVDIICSRYGVEIWILIWARFYSERVTRTRWLYLQKLYTFL